MFSKLISYTNWIWNWKLHDDVIWNMHWYTLFIIHCNVEIEFAKIRSMICNFILSDFSCQFHFCTIFLKYTYAYTYFLYQLIHSTIYFFFSYSCNKITTTQIQISRQNWNGLFSNISHQIMIWLTPIVSREKTSGINPKKSRNWH